MSCPLKFNDLVTSSLKIFLLGLFCGCFQFVPESSAVVFPSFLHCWHCPLPSFICFDDHFLYNQWPYRSLLTFATISLIVCNTHFLILFHCTSMFPPSKSIALSFSSRVSCTFYFWAYNFSTSHLGLSFWNLMTFFNLVQIFATSRLWSGSITAPGSVCTSFILFLNRYFTSI